jgi:hypothetical protein
MSGTSSAEDFLSRLNAIAVQNAAIIAANMTPAQAVELFREGCIEGQDGDGKLKFLVYEFPKEMLESPTRDECISAIRTSLIDAGLRESRDKLSGKMFGFAGMLIPVHNCDTTGCRQGPDRKPLHNIARILQFCHSKDEYCTRVYIYP